jgi:carboxylate-amine ligase
MVAACCSRRRGAHPFSHWRDQEVTGDSRYRALAESYQDTLLRQLTFGLHVHIGVQSGDEAINACDRLRAYLPVLLAVSANSPFWCGRLTGLQSHRIEVMGSLPMGGIPPYLENWASFVGLVDHLVACSLVESAKDLWWDVRPNALLGTVEVRICDMPLRLDEVLGLTALIQCLVSVLSRGEGPKVAGIGPQQTPDDHGSYRMLLQQNRWLASRYGLGAMLADPLTRQRRAARELALELIELLTPSASALGCMKELKMLRTRTRGPNGAEMQLAAYSRSRDLVDAVLLMIWTESAAYGHSRPRHCLIAGR